MPLTIRYNDLFDAAHYPITTEHRDIVKQIAAQLSLDDNAGWLYEATLQGAIFSCQDRAGLLARVTPPLAAFLLTIPGLRWYEHDPRTRRASFAVAHK